MMKLLNKLEITRKFNALLVLLALMLFDEIAFVNTFVDTTEFDKLDSSVFDGVKEFKPELLEDYAYHQYGGDGQFPLEEVSDNSFFSCLWQSISTANQQCT